MQKLYAVFPGFLAFQRPRKSLPTSCWRRWCTASYRAVLGLSTSFDQFIFVHYLLQFLIHPLSKRFSSRLHYSLRLRHHEVLLLCRVGRIQRAKEVPDNLFFFNCTRGKQN